MFQIMKGFMLGPTPHKFGFATTIGHLVDIPCDMGEPQYKSAIEFGNALEALKLGLCCRG
jgi:hypothetical protein